MDLFNQKSLLIPNSFADFITDSFGKSEKEIFKSYPKSEKETILEYINWLYSYGYIEWVKKKSLIKYFRPLNTSWESPSLITNIIVDIAESQHHWGNIIAQINFLNIPILQIRLFKITELKSLYSILNQVENSTLKGIEIILPYTDEYAENNLQNIFNFSLRIYQLIIYNAPSNSVSFDACVNYPVTVIYTTNDIKPDFHCGIISEFQFSTNTQLYTESINHNSCLNRKISIDQHGEIKNCPSMSKSYGNINDITLEEAYNKTGFKDLWNITKDQIFICKECEFRHICTDCRAYLQDPKDIYSKPLKCGYDPYTNKWEDWSTNPLSKLAIDYYNLNEIVFTDK